MNYLATERLASKLFQRVNVWKLIIWCASALVALILMLPVAYLFVRASETGDAIWDILFSLRTARVLLRTVYLATSVTLGSALLAVPIAWLTARSDLPMRRLWTILTALPLVVPSYVGAYLFISVLGPRGILQQWLEPLGVQRLPKLYGFPGAFVVLTLLSYPYILTTTRAALMRMNPALEEASRNLGNGPWSTFWRVTLPQLRPGLAAGGLLVALYVLRDFGAVSFMRYSTFTRVLYIQYQSSFDRTGAAVLALVLILLTLFVLLIEIRTRGRAKYYGGHVGAVGNPMEMQLGHWRWPSLLFCAIVVILSLVLPASILVYWFLRGISVTMTFPSLWLSAWNSVVASGLASGLVLMAAVPVAWLSVRQKGRFAMLLERISYSAFALPGIVVALALVFFGANYANPIYQTVYLLLFGYLIMFLPQAVGALRTSFLQISPSIEHAARTLGKNPLYVFRTITVPVSWPGIAAGFALVFLTVMKELPITLILGPLGFSTLATSVWSAVEEAMFGAAAAPALLLILLSSVPMALIALRERV